MLRLAIIATRDDPRLGGGVGKCYGSYRCILKFFPILIRRPLVYGLHRGTYPV